MAGSTKVASESSSVRCTFCRFSVTLSVCWLGLVPEMPDDVWDAAVRLLVLTGSDREGAEMRGACFDW